MVIKSRRFCINVSMKVVFIVVPPVVSVIMPMYNASRFIEESILSVLNQTFNDWELIVVDDYSTDDSVSLVRSFFNDDRIHILTKDGAQPKGVISTRNLAIRQATGRYIAFLDADDVWYPSKLEQQLDYVRDKHLGICILSYETIEEDGRLRNVVRVPHKINKIQYMTNTITCAHTVMVDTDVIPKSALVIPENIGKDFAEDYAMWLRCFDYVQHMYGLDFVLAKYRRHGSSRSARKLLATKKTWNTMRLFSDLSFINCVFYLVVKSVNSIKRRLPNFYPM